jgi:hypothetical protein
MQQAWSKDPSENLDYQFDFAARTNGSGPEDYLAPGETILSYTVTVSPDGLIIDPTDLIKGNTVVLLWIRGGDVAVRRYRITVEIATTSARTVQRSNTLTVRER